MTCDSWFCFWQVVDYLQQQNVEMSAKVWNANAKIPNVLILYDNWSTHVVRPPKTHTHTHAKDVGYDALFTKYGPRTVINAKWKFSECVWLAPGYKSTWSRTDRRRPKAIPEQTVHEGTTVYCTTGSTFCTRPNKIEPQSLKKPGPKPKTWYEPRLLQLPTILRGSTYIRGVWSVWGSINYKRAPSFFSLPSSFLHFSEQGLAQEEPTEYSTEINHDYCDGASRQLGQ